jgi:ribosomal protein L32E
MRSEESLRVFDRANWRRKARVPTWRKPGGNEMAAAPRPETKTPKEW